MKILSTLIFVFSSLLSLAQSNDTIYIDFSNQSCEPEKAYEYMYWIKQPNGKYIVYKRNYSSRKLVETSECNSVKPFVRDGVCNEFGGNGHIRSTCIYVNDLLQDTLTKFDLDGKINAHEIYKDDTAVIEFNYYENRKIYCTKQYREGKIKKIEYYYETGELKRKEAFARNGEMMVSQCFTKSGADTTYFPAKVEPIFTADYFKNLEAFIDKSLMYPFYAVKNGIQGKAIIQFTITADSDITDIEVLYSDHEVFSEEGIRVVKRLKGKFKPGTIEGKPVSMSTLIPFSFKLN